MMELRNIDDVDIDDIDDVDNIHINIPKRYVRDAQDPFNIYFDSEFQKRYRFSKASVMYGILPEIQEPLTKINNRGLSIPAITQLLICLRFYATGSFQVIVADTASVSQSTISRVVFRVSALLASLLKRYIKMPQNHEGQTENRRLFRVLGMGNHGTGIPDADGALDCTHIRLIHTRFGNIDEVYRNRKRYFSLNVQAVVGPRMEFLDIVPKWPGSTHDSRIFQNSRIYMKYFEGRLNGLLIGDAGYPCLPFLMTPIANPVTDEEATYNIIQKRTRQVVERTFGVWKRRFPCLSRGLSNKLLCSTTIIVSCAVLHNMALRFHDVLPEIEEQEFPPLPPHWQPLDGFAVREQLIARMFN